MPDPTSANPFVREQGDGVVLCVKVQPRASRNEVCGLSGQELRVRVTAPPVDSAANQALIKFLAERLELPPGRLQLLRGAASRHKQIWIQGVGIEAVLRSLRLGTAPLH